MLLAPSPKHLLNCSRHAVQNTLRHADELEKPYKLVKKRAAAKPPGASQRFGARRASVSGRGDDSNEDADEPASSEQLDGSSAAAGSAPSMNKLYGRWQTEPWRRPVALNGVVPKNARGNVECPPLLKVTSQHAVCALCWETPAQLALCSGPCIPDMHPSPDILECVCLMHGPRSRRSCHLALCICRSRASGQFAATYVSTTLQRS
eukprot:361277-Chlamydomonas_euryale.AAC.3